MTRQTIVNVRHQAAVHTSGSKFYEIFLFENDFGSFFISRYGKIGQMERGGQESFDAAAPSSGESSYESKLRQKFGAKGGYTEAPKWSLHGDPSAVLRDKTAPDFQRRFDMTDTLDAHALKASLFAIFGTDEVLNQIKDALNLPGPGDAEMIAVPEFEEVPEEVRAADESWGAW